MENKLPLDTPLHFAVRIGDMETVKMLLDRGGDIDARSLSDVTPLHIAVESKKLEIVELLLNQGACVNARNCNSSTPLLLAAKVGSEEIVKLLLQHGADVNSSDDHGRSALHFTVLGEDGRFCRYKPDKDRNVNVMEEMAKLLLSWGANANAQIENGKTTLHVASQLGYVKVAEALLEHNADVNCTVTKNDITSPNIAAYEDHLFVEDLLRSCDFVDSVDDYTRTALHLAAEQGYLDIVEVLLKFGASVNSIDEYGTTPLHLAAREGHLEVVKSLLKFGAGIDSRDADGITPLHYAAERHVDIVEFLLKFGASIDSQDKAGETALHIASDEGHEQTVIALLEHGSDINIVNKNSKTALDSAKARFNSVVYILECHIVKMKTANLFVSKYNLLSISKNDEVSDFENRCAEQIASMKSEKVGNSFVSFYDILTKGISQVAMYARNESIVQVLRTDYYKVKFPIYASLININFRKGKRRKQLLEQGVQIFHTFFNNFSGLPHVCTAEIFSYLSDEDLRSLIDVCNVV